ncbi:hypothetical protein RG47T_2202 [Mucilaginibacter polytrichastri]|uniref:PDZ domain-containing protein n=2 Tax=Mucilaginibacter polytrichastri TaxID=1302689 RepID=A0A1Q5ZY98_9SPHI|nr:hypothetical protein RG47T_2202 [Mucilaginibacter polytrichastri]
MAYVVSMDNPASHLYHVELTCSNIKQPALYLNMCAWTPGFYEIIDFEKEVENFTAAGANGKPITWQKTAPNIWKVKSNYKGVVKISYDVNADNPFIANLNLDENHGYIIPGGLLMYLQAELRHPVTLQIKPYSRWPQTVATGLNPLPGKINTFYASDFDELYDSPLLMGKLEELPVTLNGGKPVGFTAYGLGDFNREEFMADLKKIVTTGSSIIGDIPYTHYTFLAVGMNGRGFGGIEHLNSASLTVFNGNLLAPNFKESFYSFLAHEYFHTYNVKRIRPIALGPFDYSKENYTNLLWVSEGFTDYYQYLILNRAGLMSGSHVLEGYTEHIKGYENTPGHLYQTANQASRGIWAQRGKPTERTPEEISKTISVYEKGCTLGMLLDLKIRHETGNARSLDDVMRALYKDYFRTKKRGFTDIEFKQECERIAGTPLDEFFSYASTVKPVNYPKYLAYAGLAIDTTLRAMPVLYMGANVRKSSRDSSLLVTDVTWQSSASDAGLQKGDKITEINGLMADKQLFDNTLKNAHPGDKLQLGTLRGTNKRTVTLTLSIYYEKSFNITELPKPTALQTAIYTNWLKK